MTSDFKNTNLLLISVTIYIHVVLYDCFQDKLIQFILASQDEETGGFADRPGDMVDPFHTLFGIAGLSLLGEERIKPVNPVFCMSEEVIQRAGIRVELL